MLPCLPGWWCLGQLAVQLFCMSSPMIVPRRQPCDTQPHSRSSIWPPCSYASKAAFKREGGGGSPCEPCSHWLVHALYGSGRRVHSTSPAAIFATLGLVLSCRLPTQLHANSAELASDLLPNHPFHVLPRRLRVQQPHPVPLHLLPLPGRHVRLAAGGIHHPPLRPQSLHAAGRPVVSEPRLTAGLSMAGTWRQAQWLASYAGQPAGCGRDNSAHPGACLQHPISCAAAP